MKEVILHNDDLSFNLLKHLNNNEEIYIANLISLGKTYFMFKRKTWKYLITLGMDIHVNNDANIHICGKTQISRKRFLLMMIVYGGHFKTTKYLTENGVISEIPAALNIATFNKNYKIINYLKLIKL
ncbi:putative ankyrin repeat protein [Acanthamoeba polyphaga mimivirus]|uniref:Putative ankyrin repeat protein n=1 Tax=Acanthamoeba polyphaga mimivirus TaxID=212035 RepID=A0A0G2Y2V6_MIMIV|nr:putative ankyrin repeat protein [Acanthamoeba polyphaga mimivirus]